jgi:hypothetical protein
VPVWQWLSAGRDKDATSVIYGKEDPGLRAVILSVKPRQNGICDIEAVLEDERVHDDPGPAPPWTPGGEVPVASMRPVIIDLSASYDLPSGLLTLTWAPDAAARGYQVQYRSYDTWQTWIPDSDGGHWEYDEWGGATWIPDVPAHYETRTGWSEWNDLGEGAGPSRSFVVPQRLVEYRVRGMSAAIAGLWTMRQADCSKAMPGTPVLSLTSAYVGGNLALSWPAIAAETVTVTLRSGGADKYSKAVPGGDTGSAITASDVQASGGPWRVLEVGATAKNGDWQSIASPLTVADSAPAIVQGLEVTLDAGIAHVSWQAATDSDVTGYVVGHKNALGEISRVETDALSVDIPVDVGTHTFTVAGKDALYDLIQDVAALNFTAPVAVEVVA